MKAGEHVKHACEPQKGAEKHPVRAPLLLGDAGVELSTRSAPSRDNPSRGLAVPAQSCQTCPCLPGSSRSSAPWPTTVQGLVSSGVMLGSAQGRAFSPPAPRNSPFPFPSWAELKQHWHLGNPLLSPELDLALCFSSSLYALPFLCLLHTPDWVVKWKII